MCFLIAGGSSCLSSDVQELAKSLDSSYEKYRQDVSFYATFKLTEGFVEVCPELLDDIAIDDIEQVFSGRLIRRLGVFRISFDAISLGVSRSEIQENVSRAAEVNGVRVTSINPEDLVVSDDKSLVYRKSSGDVVDHAVFFLRSDKPDEQLKSGGCSGLEMHLNTLNPIPGCNFRPFSGHSVLAGAIPEFELLKTSEERLTIRINSKAVISGNSYQQEQLVEWDLTATPPVIVSVDRRFLLSDGKLSLRSRSKQFDFVECLGGSVARRVIHVVEQPRKPPRVNVWTSEDLGNREPVDEDFVITVPASTLVSGLGESYTTEEMTRLDLLSLNDNEIKRADPAKRKQLLLENTRARSGTFVRLILANVALILCLLFGYLYWKRA